MGKTSTTKASKKKTASKKKEPAKKVKADLAASGPDSDIKPEETRVTVESKAPKNTKTSVSAAKPAQKKPLLLSDLLLLKFDARQPDSLFAPIPDKTIIPDAPPFVSGKDDQETGRIKALLFNSFDMKTIIADGERFAAEKAEAERIAAEKAAAEKAEAERIAAEKAAAEKAEAERIAAEKAAAEKAEAERIAAEKAAAEKAEAERIAAEKAAAEKAEAERIAAEKAAAEKAEAERIAAEKAAAEKAEAERIAAEKAAAILERKKAAELQQASAPKVKVTYDQPVQPELPTKSADPVDKTIIIFAGCLALLVLLLITTSLCNSQKYYIKPAKNGIEIWQGRFAPKGEQRLISLAGVKTPETARKVYSKMDVYPIIFSYFLNKADAFLDAPGIPDFEGMKYYINLAQPYAVTQELRDAAAIRLNGMTQTLQNFKAGIAASKAPTAGKK
jgi:hypothetical protein